MISSIKNISLFCALSVLLLLPTDKFAATTSLTANAEVVASLSVIQTTALDFGTFALINSATTGTRVTNGADTNIDEMVAVTAGLVTLAGGPNLLVNISVGNASLTDTGGNGGTAMTATLSVPSATVTLDGTGAGTSTVNGSLAVGALQTVSTYSGTATVTVNY